MRKIYFLVVALIAGFTLNAQIVINDDFESYPLGPYFGGHWSNWSMTSINNENIIISDTQAFSGSQSGYIGNNGNQDAILVMNMVSDGVWTIQFNMFIDNGSTAYFNIQQLLDMLGEDGNWAHEFYVGMDPTVNTYPATPGTGYLTSLGVAYPFEYPTGEWFKINLTIDLNEGYTGLAINDADQFPPFTVPYGGDMWIMEGLDFYSFSDYHNNSYYIDDMIVAEGTLGIKDLTAANIDIYPTLVRDMVNVTAKTQIDQVAVYNTNGQLVKRMGASGNVSQIDMSSLSSGVYIIKVQAGKETLTKKVVKK